MTGTAGASQSGSLGIGMLMGISSFGAVAGTSGIGGTTYGTTQPSVATTATGSAQALNLVAGVYANSTAVAGTANAGLWIYTFNVNLDF